MGPQLVFDMLLAFGVELDPKGWFSQSLIEKKCLGGLEHAW